MRLSECIKIANSCFKNILRKGMGREGLILPAHWEDLETTEEKLFFENLAELFKQFNESYEFAEHLSKGSLATTVSRENVFAMPLKALQANLNHLTWQTNQVANGNLSQQVFFLGDFSAAFNNMIVNLREKQVLEQRLQTITDTIGEGLFLVDGDGQFVFANPEALKMLEYEFEEIQGKGIHETVFCQQPNGTRLLPETNPIWLAVKEGAKQDESDAVFTAKSGMIVPVMYSCRPIKTEDSLNGAVISFQDISIQKKYLQSLETVNELLEEQASTDALTGISNRLKFDKSLAIETKKAERYSFPLSLILFDIDHFKRVNDTHGHSIGDEVLKKLARLVSGGLRETDLFARWGGEEFVVLCPGSEYSSCIRVAERLRKLIASFDFLQPTRVTASFGVSAFEKGDTPTKFMNRADSALYRAKENGRNRVVGEVEETSS